MSTTRVYGQQVIVKLFDASNRQSFLVEFDSISIDRIQNNQQYKTIGKSMAKHHEIINGYRIELSRSKRDSFLDEFIDLCDKIIISKFNPLNISLRKQTIFSNTKQVNFNQFEESEDNRQFNALLSLALRKSLGGQQIANLNALANNLALSASSAFSSANEAIALATSLQRLNDLYVETKNFYDCSIAGFTDNVDGQKSLNEQKLILNCSHSNIDTTNDEYSQFIQPLLLDNSVTELQNILDNKQQSIGNLIQQVVGNNPLIDSLTSNTISTTSINIIDIINNINSNT